MSSSPGFDFSFAGLKTAVLYHLKKNTREKQEDVAASFLASVVDVLTKKSLEATRRYHLKRLVVVGGVARAPHERREGTRDRRPLPGAFLLHRQRRHDRRRWCVSSPYPGRVASALPWTGAVALTVASSQFVTASLFKDEFTVLSR